MDYRGQGAIEYLLIIGAAILVVAIVILAITGVLSGGQQNLDSTPVNNSNNLLGCQADLDFMGSNATGTCKTAEGVYTPTACVCCTTHTATQVPNCQ